MSKSFTENNSIRMWCWQNLLTFCGLRGKTEADEENVPLRFCPFRMKENRVQKHCGILAT